MDLLNKISDTHIMLKVEDDSVVILDSKIQPKIVNLQTQLGEDNKIETRIDGSELILVDNNESDEIIIFKLNPEDTELEPVETKEASTDTHVCRICNKAFLREGYLRKHQKRHAGVKQLECKFCDMKFLDSSNLKRHVSTHVGGKPFECDTCKMTFSRNSSLKDHIRIHTGERPYQCHFCDKIFSRGTTLKIHERVHTGEKPFACNMCDKMFSCTGNLKRHERKYHCESSDCDNPDEIGLNTF